MLRVKLALSESEYTCAVDKLIAAAYCFRDIRPLLITHEFRQTSVILFKDVPNTFQFFKAFSSQQLIRLLSRKPRDTIASRSDRRIVFSRVKTDVTSASA